MDYQQLGWVTVMDYQRLGWVTVMDCQQLSNGGLAVMDYQQH